MSRKKIYVRDIAQALESWADPDSAESYDNIGLHVGSALQEVHHVLIALDLTPSVLEEAITAKASLILTHHPLLFRAPSRIVEEDLIGRLILRLARENIALYSIHTNLDAAPDGVSVRLAEILGLQHISFLNPKETGAFGMGAIGHLPQAEPFTDFLTRLHQKLKVPALRYTGKLEKNIQTVAVCGGAGGGLIPAALNSDADVYVTADLSYHRFFEVMGPEGQCRMALIDAGHYETEKHTEQLLCTWLETRFPTIEFSRTGVVTSPVKYSTF